MMDIIVMEGQSLPDIAVQYGGNIEAWFDVAVANGLALDAAPDAGSKMKVNDVPVDNNVRRIYLTDDVKVATLRGEDNGGDYNNDYSNDYDNRIAV